eukprot:3846120-Karenia_brevis.AAC.1
MEIRAAPCGYRVFLVDVMPRRSGYRFSGGLYGRELRIPCFLGDSMAGSCGYRVFLVDYMAGSCGYR